MVIDLIKDKINQLIPQDLLEELSSEVQDKLGCVSKEEFSAKCKQLSRLEKQINILEFEVEEMKQKHNTQTKNL